MFSDQETLKLFPQVNSLKKSSTVYLDSAATSLKFGASIEAQYKFDREETSNVHRGSYKLSSEATYRYEESRTKIAKYLSCEPEQIVFTKGTTEAVNIIATSFEKELIKDDAILISEMEHHANLIPWQRLSQKTGAELVVCSVDQKGELDLVEIEKIYKSKNIKITSLCHISNTLGTENPIEKIQGFCREYGSLLFIDGAQAVSVKKPDLKELDADFYAFSTHKLFGPFGLGILFVKDIRALSPHQVGGGIIDQVEFQSSTFLSGPQKMEAGTPNISAVVALAPLIDFLETLDFKKIVQHESNLLKKAEKELSKIEGFQVIGNSPTKINILSFNFEGVHPNDLCELLDEQGVALRAGHLCTQPLLRKMGVSGCARASFSVYNTESDVGKLVNAVKKAVEILR